MMRWLLLAFAVLLLAPATTAQDLTRETAQVEDLRAIREIKRLQALWGHYALAGDWKGMASLVVPGIVLADGLVEYRGRDGIEEWLRETQGHGDDGMPAHRLNLRLYFSPVITLAADGQGATGRWHEVALIGIAEGGAEWHGATHVIDYRKTDEGWRIAASRPYDHFAGSYADGWTHDANGLRRALYHYTPDEAGRILPDRRASAPLTREELDRQATLLLAQSRAQNTVNAFGYYLDRAMYQDIADLFSPDAEIDVAGQGVYRGHPGVLKFLGRFGAEGLETGELNDRPQLMPLASVAADGSMALVRTIELGMTGQHGGEGFWSVAVQTFLLRPDESGAWRIALMHRTPVMRADYRAGWAEPLAAALPIGESLWPDGPSQLAAMDYPQNAFTLPPFGRDLVMPARGTPGPLAPVPDALAMAEAFDGAENVSNAYGYYIDQFSWRNTGAVFAREGWKELSYIGTFIGKDRVTGSMIQRYGEGGPNPAFQAIHQKTQPYVTVLGTGDRAHVRTRLMQFNSSATGPGSWIGGIYENQVVKEDGVWRIHGMDLDYVWLGDYATGWTGIDPEASRRFAPTPEQLEAFGPDAPLRGETFAPYPRIAPMGFHYANPVSGREPETRLTWSDGHR